MSLVGPAAPSTLANRAAVVVLVAQQTSFLMVRSARCLLEDVVDSSFRKAELFMIWEGFHSL